MAPNLGLIFLSELVGTAMLLLLGCGVVANVALKGTKGNGGGFLMVTWGWGLAVFVGVLCSAYSGGHLNPAVTVGLAIKDAANGIDGTDIAVRIAAQMVGAMLGATLCWLSYKQHFDEEPEAAAKLAVFSTGPAIRSYGWNLVTEIVGTFVLVLAVISFANFGVLKQPDAATGVELSSLGNLGPLAVALVVVAIGASLGGPTGYAINPARDLGPRIVHAVLPIKGKGGSDWGYAWVPVVGPLIGGSLAGLVGVALLPAVG
ncbi:MAG: MIP/aquaporin family protein [Pseudoclavibacter sp.]|nr:MIP/aquaporin family protein [Pseudoclavibacter sp.]